MDVTLSRNAVTSSRSPRFERIAISSVFGNPLDRKTWSGAPANVARALERLGVTVRGIHPHVGKMAKARIAFQEFCLGRGLPLTGEQILRSIAARRELSAQTIREASRIGIRHILHTGTFDLLEDAALSNGKCHYLYCDHTWNLARRYKLEAARYTGRALKSFEDAERRSLRGLEHVFTFGKFVRGDLIAHYGLSPDRVTAVGSGMGAIETWKGPKDYTHPSLLFVAKHLFREKGGLLLLEAFRLARRQREDLRLTIVGDERSKALAGPQHGVSFLSHLPWEELQRLYRDATLLVQPMLNDPWGQVYLEAMVSRTPVLGLARNGLPELVDDGHRGFLVDRADPEALAGAILCAVSDPARLERIAKLAQDYVLRTHSWDHVAELITFR
jgi:glycosyltransferase involved in cell wall biosynthesis